MEPVIASHVITAFYYFPEQLLLPLQLFLPLQLSLPLQESADFASTLAADLSADLSAVDAQPVANKSAAADASAKPVNFVALFMLRISLRV